ncbi:hypothetical protein B296_00042992 [Ensete ventricosum]|uniref:Uncharacterized protein n=1 Tax=Ensete ventricosum TaxID=4639 RepID=A0A426ZGG6_ENSVE|nr:hypothetical protein B296_00042992 [Ensete ventricosum]
MNVPTQLLVVVVARSALRQLGQVPCLLSWCKTDYFRGPSSWRGHSELGRPTICRSHPTQLNSDIFSIVGTLVELLEGSFDDQVRALAGAFIELLVISSLVDGRAYNSFVGWGCRTSLSNIDHRVRAPRLGQLAPYLRMTPESSPHCDGTCVFPRSSSLASPPGQNLPATTLTSQQASSTWHPHKLPRPPVENW